METVALGDASEEEAEELFADQGKSKSTPPPDRETKKEREDRLKKMMEDDDGTPAHSTCVFSIMLTGHRRRNARCCRASRASRGSAHCGPTSPEATRAEGGGKCFWRTSKRQATGHEEEDSQGRRRIPW
jgi:hypothetical protein